MRLIYEIANALLESRSRRRPAPTRRVRRNPRGTCYLIPAKLHKNVDALCRNRSQQPADDTTTDVTARLDFLIRIVLASGVKSCEHDPLPTSLLRAYSFCRPRSHRKRRMRRRTKRIDLGEGSNRLVIAHKQYGRTMSSGVNC